MCDQCHTCSRSKFDGAIEMWSYDKRTCATCFTGVRQTLVEFLLEESAISTMPNRTHLKNFFMDCTPTRTHFKKYLTLLQIWTKNLLKKPFNIPERNLSKLFPSRFALFQMAFYPPPSYFINLLKLYYEKDIRLYW